MNTISLSGFQELETQWIEATDMLARREAALREAMHAYRQHRPQCRPSRVAQALAEQEEAKRTVQSLMRRIWSRLF